MSDPLFAVKPYDHGKYKYLVRGKVRGQWRRRYFRAEGDALAFSEQQNARARLENGDASPQDESAPKMTEFASPWLAEKPQPKRLDSPEDLSKLAFSTYLGPRIKRYLGDSWCMHLPFAYDLMRELAPTVFVELGVKLGESYFAFCQSAVENKIKVRCYGIDSWIGDRQTGGLDPEIQLEVAAYNSRYSSFSELRTMFFAEAVKDFADASIDLLHIDGTHTYAEVKSDLESWLPKLSQNGIVLFHDVMLRGQGFGVWKLWQEITRSHDSFLFEFGCGLGVWMREPAEQAGCSLVRRLLAANKAEARRLNEYYANAGAALALWKPAPRNAG